MPLQRITEGLTGQQAADLIYDNDQYVLDQSLTKDEFITYDELLKPVLSNRLYYFNGINSEVILPSSIFLRSNGDYIEFNAIFYNENGAVQPGLGAFGRRLSNYGGVGHQNRVPVVRDTTTGDFIIPRDGGTMVFDYNEEVKLKYSWESGVVVIYLNNVEIRRSTSQGTVEINNIGNSYTTESLANMSLNGVKIVSSGVSYDFSSLIDAGKLSNVELKDPKGLGFLTEEQNDRLIPVGVNYTEQGGYPGTAKSLADKINALSEGKTFFTHYNGVDSLTKLDKTYTISATGDYFEVKFRFPSWLNSRELSFLGLQGGNNNIFIHGNTADVNLGFTIRDNSGNWIMLGAVLSPGELAMWNTARVEIISGNNFQLTLNGTVYPAVPMINIFQIDCVAQAYSSMFALCDVEFLDIHSSLSGNFYSDSLYNLTGSENTENHIEQNELAEQENLPNCFIDYSANRNNTGRKHFRVYTRYANSSYYVGFELEHEYSENPIYYTNQYRITLASLFRYSGVNFIDLGTVIITNGESECVFYQVGGSPVDHTGGAHGDEQLINVKFYIDGVLLTEEDLESDFVRACSKFHYIQKSSFHKTGTYQNIDTGITASGSGALSVDGTTKYFMIDGILTNIVAYSQNSYITNDDLENTTLSVSESNTWIINRVRVPYEDHPIVAYHWKYTTFREAGYDTKNRVQWTEGLNNYIYCGMVCINRTNGKYIYSEVLDDFIETNGDGGYKCEYIDSPIREITFTNPDTGLGAIVTSQFENSDMDDTCTIFVWDASPTRYTKYYRRNATRTPSIGEIYVMQCNVTLFRNNQE